VQSSIPLVTGAGEVRKGIVMRLRALPSADSLVSVLHYCSRGEHRRGAARSESVALKRSLDDLQSSGHPALQLKPGLRVGHVDG
jgi:hypothetical protein